MGDLTFLLIVGMAVSLASAYLGSFMVLKRMALVGDALSHVALPGMAIAISLSINPILGALVFLLIAAIIIWYLEQTTDVYPETLVGILFTSSLAIGILLTKEPDLLEALFGNIKNIGRIEGVSAIILSAISIAITYFISKSLLIQVVSEDIAKSIGINTKKVNLIYLLLVSLIVALGVKYVGTLLMGALAIIPPAASKNIAKGMNSYYLLSGVFALTSSMIGICVSYFTNIETGPIIVLINSLIFLVTYVIKRFSAS
jgi:ABC-type Mn2+/Zn2+ transport system permease subunit